MFALSVARIQQALEAGVCEVTGIAFEFTKAGRGNQNPWGPSLDRKDPSRGYTDENTRVVVWAYNAAKQQWSDATVMALAKAVIASETS